MGAVMSRRTGQPGSGSGAHARWFARALLSAILVVSVALAVYRLAPTSAAGASLRIEAPDSAVVGQPMQISLWLEDAANVAGYEATLLFDTESATFHSIEHRNTNLARLGRDVQTIGPDEVPGGVAIGAFSCSFSSCLEADSFAKQHGGGTGLVRLTTFSIVPHKTGPLTIVIDQPVFVDVHGAPISVTLGETRLTVRVEGS